MRSYNTWNDIHERHVVQCYEVIHQVALGEGH